MFGCVLGRPLYLLVPFLIKKKSIAKFSEEKNILSWAFS